MTFADIMAVYCGSNGEATKALYKRLEAMPPRGPIAMNLVRTCKASERAKAYRGRYVAAAYDKKDWSIAELCRELVLHGDDAGIVAWGWGWDAKAINFENVLYVEIPGAGQVSFHSGSRRDGPDFDGLWDGIRNEAPNRICKWVEAVLDGRDLPMEETNDVARQDRAEGVAAESAPGREAGAGEDQETFEF